MALFVWLLLPLALVVDDTAPYSGPPDPVAAAAAARAREDHDEVQRWLGTDGSEAALSNLMDEGTPSFRVHAYRQFVELSGRVYLGPLLAHLGDPDPLNLGSDCDVFQVLVGDQLLAIAWPRLNPEELRRVRAAVYLAPVPLRHRLDMAAEDPAPGPALLEAAERDPRLLAVLAERRFAPVLPLVVAALDDPERREGALDAVAAWPHPSLFGPFRRAAEALLRAETAVGLEAYYRAAAAWPARRAKPFLRRAFEPHDRPIAHFVFLSRALERHPKVAFDDLRWRLVAEGVANEQMLCRLDLRDPDRLRAAAAGWEARPETEDLRQWRAAASGRACDRPWARPVPD